MTSAIAECRCGKTFIQIDKHDSPFDAAFKHMRESGHRAVFGYGEGI